MTLLFDETFEWVDPKDWERCRNRLDVADVYAVPHRMVIHNLLTPEAAQRLEHDLSYNFIYGAGPETLERMAEAAHEELTHQFWASLTLGGIILALCAVVYVLCDAAYRVGWALGS